MRHTEQHGAQAYMLLCDNAVRDYGDPEVAVSFAEKCDAPGHETIVMRDEFKTICGDGVVKTEITFQSAA